MSVHSSLLELLSALDYGDHTGICRGFTMRWLEANFLGKTDQQIFEKRIKKLVEERNHIVGQIKKVKAKRGIHLTQNDKELIDILAFLDSIMLFQNPAKFTAFFNTPYSLNQQDIKTISILASSQAINERGGLNPIYTDSGIYNKQEIANYFSGLWEVIHQSKIPPTQPFGMVISNMGHSIALKYSESGWIFMDINQYPPQEINIKNPILLAGKIQNAFKPLKCEIFLMDRPSKIENCKLSDKTHLHLYKEGGNYVYYIQENGNKTKYQLDHPTITDLLKHENFNQKADELVASDNPDLIQTILSETGRRGHTLKPAVSEPFRALNSTIVTTGNDFQLRDKLLENLASFRNKHVITKEIVSRVTEDNVSLAHLACLMNNEELLDKLIKLNVDFTIATHIDHFTPFHHAVCRGHVEIVKKLAVYNPELIHILTDEGWTALMIAAANGYVEVVKALIEAKADINVTNNAGHTAFLIAIQNNQIEVVRLLVKLYPHLIHETTKMGVTPLIEAAAYDNVDIVKMLADLNVDINQADSKGGTALFAAAQYGNQAVFSELMRRNADVNLSLTDTKDNLMKFAEKHKVTERMQLIVGRNSSDDNVNVSITPYEIAWIMGHEIETPLVIAIHLGKWETIEKMPIRETYSQKELATKDSNGKTLLQYAIETNNKALIMNILMSPSCDENVLTIQNSNNITPLHYFMKNEDAKLLEYLSHSPYLVKALVILLDNYIRQRKKEKSEASKIQLFFESLIIDADIKINAAIKIKEAILDIKIDLFTHDELIALKHDRLGEIVSLLDQKQWPKSLIESKRIGDYNFMRRY